MFRLKVASRNFRRKDTTDEDAKVESNGHQEPEIKEETKSDASGNSNKEKSSEDEYKPKIKAINKVSKLVKARTLQSTVKPTPSTTTAPTSVTPSKLSNRLSFADEEEDEPSKDFKKKKIKKRPLRRDFPIETDSTISGSTPASATTFGTYTPEALEQLKKTSLQYYEVSNKEIQEIEMEVEVEDGDKDVEMELDEESKGHRILNAEEAEKLEEQEDEEDEEFKRWEYEQIKKGGAGTLGEKLKPKMKGKPTKSPSQILPTTPAIVVSVDEIQKKLRSSLQTLEENYELHENRLKKATSEIENSTAKLETLESEYKTVSEDYVYFQDMREFIADFTDCMAAKAPIIEQCEEDLINLDIEYVDNLKKVHGPFPADRLLVYRSKEYNDAKEVLMSKAVGVFSDTFEEYSSIKAIKYKFEIWKFNHGASYKQAFISLSIPLLFAPLVRLELFKWDLLVDSKFENMNWYTELFDYGIDKNATHVDPSDEDPNLVPNLIAKVLVPKSVKIIAHIWNPFSKYQSEKVNEFLGRLLDYLEPQSDAMKEAFTAVLVGIRGAIEAFTHFSSSVSLSDEQLDNILQLIQNISLFQSALSPDQMQTLIVDNIINPKILPHLNSITNQDKALDVMQRLMKEIPPQWLNNSDTASKLALFHNFVSNFAKKLSTSDRLEKASKLLMELDDKDTAKKLLQKFKRK